MEGRWLPRAPPPFGVRSDGVAALWSGCLIPLDARALEQPRQSRASPGHSRLDRVFRDADNLRHLFERLLVVVDKVDDLAIFRRKFRQALSDDRTRVLLLELGRRIVCRVFDRLRSVVTQHLCRTMPEG